ncbi:peptide deformylase [Antribacter gilvus]|uniref:peptide deformylase n=1 Tax=Antribacter gilvus TaxID=2304675 RepID=UPI000F78475E|nr:peptide deformylase [Antribacter gilvus]
MTLARSNTDWITGIAGEGVVTIGDARLKAPTSIVDIDQDTVSLLDSMVARLRALNGAGLAAPQIGASVRVAVVEVRRTDVFPDRPEHPLIELINPTITKRSTDEVSDWEGCFSVPGLLGQVPRAAHITVEYTTRDGERVTREYSGYVARVIQHETDHLDAIEFIDRMPDMDSLTTVQNWLINRAARASES